MSLTKSEQRLFEKLKMKKVALDPIKFSKRTLNRLGAHLAKNRVSVVCVRKDGKRISLFTRKTHDVRVKNGKELKGKRKLKKVPPSSGTQT